MHVCFPLVLLVAAYAKVHVHRRTFTTQAHLYSWGLPVLVLNVLVVVYIDVVVVVVACAAVCVTKFYGSHELASSESTRPSPFTYLVAWCSWCLHSYVACH
jgi:hypothetical protein